MIFFGWSLLSLLVWAAADGVDVSTQVQLLRGGKPAPGESVTSTVAVWQPERRHGVEARRFEIVTARKAFQPESLVVPVGSTVAFPNRDPILHNVFSVSSGNAFDLGLLGKGPGSAVELERPGLVRIFCNVHREMFSTVLVVDSPFVAHPDASGSLHLEGLPPGPGKLVLWHPYADPLELRIDSPERLPPEIELEVKRRRVPAHFNKFGKPYARRSRGRYVPR